MDPNGLDLDRLVAAVRSSAKYRAVAPELIRSAGSRALRTRRGLPEAIKATKQALHQAAGAYLPQRVPYAALLQALRAVATDSAALRRVCLDAMRHHASTRERSTYLEPLYDFVFGEVGTVTAVIDVACGLNPLAIPWMRMAPGASYTAWDIYEDLAAFLNVAFPLLGVEGSASVCDVTQPLPPHDCDVALLLKCLPCLDRLDDGAGVRLLDRLHARWLVVSYPVASLCGRPKGMVSGYGDSFAQTARERDWSYSRHLFATEQVFVVRR